MKGFVWYILLALFFCFNYKTGIAGSKPKVKIVIAPNVSSRVLFGAEYLQTSLRQLGYSASLIKSFSSKATPKEVHIHVYTSLDSLQLKRESFKLVANGSRLAVIGGDATGTLYGCYELIDRIKTEGKIPNQLLTEDAPDMVLRGQCIGLQKPYYLPGRNVYEYPYTPETFPWFYDKKLWLQVLDSMAQNRMNSLYLWNGHPFASLVKLKDYPYAVEVDEATFKKNEEIFSFLTHEADKRGIWVIQMFYNIIVSKPFAEKNGLKTQERERPIIPIIADYTRKSIAAFVEKYPNVGLMVCLGEAMEGVGKDDIEWFTKTIIPGVRDGMRALGITKEPPIVLRAHDTDAPAVMQAALPMYKNLYTEAKFNGEALTYETPRGSWKDLHQTLSKLGSVHIENVHILANLEPFRYGATRFIQNSAIGMKEVLGGKGLHLYPQASYWDWPYTADSVKGPRLLEIERDWIWYKAWARYAWQPNRNKAAEAVYWAGAMAAKFGTNISDGRNIVEGYNEMGEIAPKLLRRFGITDGNRQTLTLGMLMTQLINPYRYGLFTLLYDGEAPEGESLAAYADKDWNGNTHIGETPIKVINDVKAHGDRAVASFDAAAAKVTKDTNEFQRLQNDAYCYKALAYHFAYKAEAALKVLRYKYSNNLKDLEAALPLLQQSVNEYEKLVGLTKGTYLYANSMQTQQRKIPMRGVDGAYKTWAEVLVPFQQELSIFRQKLDSLKNNPVKTDVNITAYQQSSVTFKDQSLKYFTIDSLAQVFSDTSFAIRNYAPELKGLQGLKLSYKNQLTQGTQISFTNSKPVKILVGYFAQQRAAFTTDTFFLKAPELETNASANDYGQADTKIANALVVPGMPQVNIHTYEFAAGSNTLKLEKGVALILGFIDGAQPIRIYDAGLYESGNKKQVDWLFE